MVSPSSTMQGVQRLAPTVRTCRSPLRDASQMPLTHPCFGPRFVRLDSSGTCSSAMRARDACSTGESARGRSSSPGRPWIEAAPKASHESSRASTTSERSTSTTSQCRRTRAFRRAYRFSASRNALRASTVDIVEWTHWMRRAPLPESSTWVCPDWGRMGRNEYRGQ
eukprot:scaffold1518_cov331-Pavlova_lutheri.AAC.16